MYLFMYMYVQNTYVYLYIHLYTYLHSRSYIYICIYTYVHTYTCIDVYMCIHIYVRIHVYIYAHTRHNTDSQILFRYKSYILRFISLIFFIWGGIDSCYVTFICRNMNISVWIPFIIKNYEYMVKFYIIYVFSFFIYLLINSIKLWHKFFFVNLNSFTCIRSFHLYTFSHMHQKSYKYTIE
jgi:hypothetical protein